MPAIFRTFQYEYIFINPHFSISKPKPKPMDKKKDLTCNGR